MSIRYMTFRLARTKSKTQVYLFFLSFNEYFSALSAFSTRRITLSKRKNTRRPDFGQLFVAKLTAKLNLMIFSRKNAV